LQGDVEELKEEDKEWITKGYVEDNEPDQYMSEEEKEVNEYDGFEENDVEMEND